MLNRQIRTLARYTLLEAVRTRLIWLFLAVLLLVYGAAYFLHELAITESMRMLTGFSAAASRLGAVFVLSLHVLTSVVREFNDKGLELVLSFDVKRSHYIVGRLSGFMLAGLLIALAAALPQFALAPANAVLQWAVTLFLELAIMSAVSLFAIITFTQVMPAASFVFAFYLLARTLTAIRLISYAPLVDPDAWSHQVMSWLVEALAFVLPQLDRFAPSAWLADGATNWPDVAGLAAQACVYLILLGAAAAFDFYRRNF